MLEINKEEISRFKQEVDSLRASMEKLKAISTVNLKISLPTDKALDKLSLLNTSIASIDTKNINVLSQSLSGLSAFKSSGLSNIYKDIESLANSSVVSAIGNLRDVSAAYGNFKTNVSQSSKTSEENQGSQRTDSFSSDLSSITKFLNLSRKIDPSNTSQLIESLKGLSEIKVDENTARFMENVNGALSGRGKLPTYAKQNNTTNATFNQSPSKADVTGTVAAALTVLSSGVFLKKQANTAKEVVDLLSASEITGLDAFSNRAGLSALGISPMTVANQQRQMNRELMSARLFGDIDPKRLVLHNILGTNFQSSSEEIMKNSLRLPAGTADYIISELFGDEFATASSRYRNATKGSTRQERKDLDSVVFSKRTFDIDVGSYSRFLIQFEGFLSLSKTLFQGVLGPSIKTLESAFTSANRYILSIDTQSKGFKTGQKVINAFVTSFVNIISFVAKGIGKLGDLIMKYNLEGLLINVASGLGALVAGGTILRVLGLTTGLLTSLLGFRSIFSLGNRVITDLAGLTLGTGKLGGKGGGGSSGGGFLKNTTGIITVALASNSIAELGNYLTIPTEGKTSDEYWRDKWSSLLKTTSAITATGAAVAGGTVAGIPAAIVLGALSLLSYGGSQAIDNPERTRDILEEIKNLLALASTPTAVPVELTIVQDVDGKLRRANNSRNFNQ